MNLLPCPFCGSQIKHVESWAKSFQPNRLYHEWHHVADNEEVCPVRRHIGKIVANATDDPEVQDDVICRWNNRAVPAQAVANPVMWVCLVPNPLGELRIRAWTADRKRMESLRAEGLDMQALYTSPVPSTGLPAPGVRLEARPADDSQEWTVIFPSQLEWAAKQGHQVRAIEIAPPSSLPAPAPHAEVREIDPELARILNSSASYAQEIRANVIEECATLIESGAGMSDLIDQDDLDQQAKYIRALATPSASAARNSSGVVPAQTIELEPDAGGSQQDRAGR